MCGDWGVLALLLQTSLPPPNPALQGLGLWSGVHPHASCFSRLGHGQICNKDVCPLCSPRLPTSFYSSISSLAPSTYYHLPSIDDRLLFGEVICLTKAWELNSRHIWVRIQLRINVSLHYKHDILIATTIPWALVCWMPDLHFLLILTQTPWVDPLIPIYSWGS